MRGQTAIITGASRGLGLAIAEDLARQGVNLHLLARNQEALESAADRLRSESDVKTYAWSLDVSDAEQVQKTMGEILAATPTVEILVNNAGITRDGLLMRMKDGDFDDVMHINLRPVFLFTRALLRPMLKQKYGRIINMSSIVGVKGQAGQANYAASKAGIIGFTKSCAREVASRGITCNAVAPGFIDSDMTRALSEEQRTGILKEIPMGRMGKAEEVATLVRFLAGPESGYISGQVLSIDGGMGI